MRCRRQPPATHLATAVGLGLLVLCVFLPGCSSGDKPAESTSADHPNRIFQYAGSVVQKKARGSDQAGQWQVRLTRGGCMTVEHRVGDVATRHGSYFLTENESSRLWRLVDRAGLASAQSPPDQQPISAEVRHVFTLTGGDTAHRVVLSEDDIDDYPAFDRLRAKVAELIETYVGITPGA